MSAAGVAKDMTADTSKPVGVREASEREKNERERNERAASRWAAVRTAVLTLFPLALLGAAFWIGRLVRPGRTTGASSRSSGTRAPPG